jgi:hypothetical protein
MRIDDFVLFEVQIKSSIRSAESQHYKDSEVTILFSSTAGHRRATNFKGARKSTDPLSVKGSIGVTAMVLAVFAASDAE